MLPMRIEPPTQRHRLRLGITPMIDVVFLLVVFFMLVSTFVDPSSISLEQTAAPGATTGDSEAIRVHIHASGGIDVDGEPVPLANLTDSLQRRLRKNQAYPVRVQADHAVSLQRLVQVLDRLKWAGASMLTLTSQ